MDEGYCEASARVILVPKCSFKGSADRPAVEGLWQVASVSAFWELTLDVDSATLNPQRSGPLPEVLWRHLEFRTGVV